MPKACVIYCRVSTEQQSRHGESLETQERNCRLFAKRNGYLIKAVFVENFSGRSQNRPAFSDMYRYIAEHKRSVDYIIFSDIDRLTRRGSSAYERIKEEVGKYGVDLIDIYGLIQPAINTLEHTGFSYDWSLVHPTEMAEKFKADMAKDEVCRILTRTVGASILLTKQGYWLRQAPSGYLNRKIFVDGKKRATLVPDAKRSRFIKLMYKWRASGKYTDKEICKRINAMGFRSKKFNRWDRQRSVIIGSIGGKPINTKQMRRLLKRPIYCGVICEKWSGYKLIQAKFEGLINLATFNSANHGKPFIVRRLDGSLEFAKESDSNAIKRRSSHNPDFPYKNIVRCPKCGKPFKGSHSRGKLGKLYGFYHCSRNHKYVGVSKHRLEHDLEKFLKHLKYRKGFMEILEQLLLNKYRKRQREIVQLAEDVSRNIANIESRKGTAIEKILVVESDVVRKELEKRVDELDRQVMEAREQRHQIELTEDDICDFIRFAKKLIENPAKMLLTTDDWKIRELLFGLVFETPPSYDEIRNGTPKLSLIFVLSKSFNDGKLPLVGQAGLRWNPLEKMLKQWLKVFRAWNCVLKQTA